MDEHDEQNAGLYFFLIVVGNGHFMAQQQDQMGERNEQDAVSTLSLSLLFVASLDAVVSHFFDFRLYLQFFSRFFLSFLYKD